MSFREFITNRVFRRRMANEIKPPENPSRKYIDKLVKKLFDESTAWNATKELKLIGPAVVPSLMTVLDSSKFRDLEQNAKTLSKQLDHVLELLVTHCPERVLSIALPLASSSSEDVRRVAAGHLGYLAYVDLIPVLKKLLDDAEIEVRSSVSNGIQYAIKDGRCSDEFAREMYGPLINQCDQEWCGTTNFIPQVVYALDAERAKIDFASPRFLSPQNPNVSYLLEVCNGEKLELPEDLLRKILVHSQPLAVGKDCYPNDYVVAHILKALVLSIGERAKPLLVDSLTSDQGIIQVYAADGLAALAGIENPIQFALSREKIVGFEGLTIPQRTVLCGFWFDVEVCNGGLLQFFGNPYGNRAVETLDALKELGHIEALHALEVAMKLVGPLSRVPDREKRLEAFVGRFDELNDAFDPLERAYLERNRQFQQRIRLYAIEHADHFREKTTF